MTQKIAVIDYGMGNLRSVSKAVEHVAGDAEVRVTDDAAWIASADRVVFPGVGAIRDCIAVLRDTGLDQAILDVIAAGKPVLGICVGMQALMSRSEENGGVDGINLFPAQVRFFGDNLVENGEGLGSRLKVPHMGWNEVYQSVDHPMWHNIPDGDRFYFVHSYYAEAEGNADIDGRSHYCVDLAAAVARDNIFAVQFHPEKSHTHGLQLLQNFAAWAGRW